MRLRHAMVLCVKEPHATVKFSTPTTSHAHQTHSPLCGVLSTPYAPTPPKHKHTHQPPPPSTQPASVISYGSDSRQ